MHTVTTWHGDRAESFALQKALDRNCECRRNEDGKTIVSVCALHIAIATEQRFVDGLLWMRRERDMLLMQEFSDC